MCLISPHGSAAQARGSLRGPSRVLHSAHAQHGLIHRPFHATGPESRSFRNEFAQQSRATSTRSFPHTSSAGMLHPGNPGAAFRSDAARDHESSSGSQPARSRALTQSTCRLPESLRHNAKRTRQASTTAFGSPLPTCNHTLCPTVNVTSCLLRMHFTTFHRSKRYCAGSFDGCTREDSWW